MDETELRDAFRRLVAAEPALALDADRVVAGGRVRLRRRRILIVAGAALVSATMVAVPAALWHTGGTTPAAGPRNMPYVTPTPGALHGGCQLQTHSGSTEGAAFAGWFVQQLPDTYQYRTDPGWQNSYQTDCVDGARSDSNEVGARVVGTDGDIVMTTERNVPAPPIGKPCTPPSLTLIGPPASPPAPSPAVTPSIPVTPSPAGTPSIPVTPSPAVALGSPGTPRPAVTPTAPGPSGREAKPGEPALAYDRCETRRQPDGSTVTIEECHDTAPELASLRSRTVIWWRTDGTVLRLTEDNRHVLDGSRPNAQLVMTVEEMLALVTNPDALLYLPPVR